MTNINIHLFHFSAFFRAFGIFHSAGSGDEIVFEFGRFTLGRFNDTIRKANTGGNMNPETAIT